VQRAALGTLLREKTHSSPPVLLLSHALKQVPLTSVSWKLSGSPGEARCASRGTGSARKGASREVIPRQGGRKAGT